MDDVKFIIEEILESQVDLFKNCFAKKFLAELFYFQLNLFIGRSDNINENISLDRG